MYIRSLNALFPVSILVALIAALYANGCEQQRQYLYKGNGVSLWQVGAPNTPSGKALKARAGDWILSSSSLQVVVAGTRKDHQQFGQFGSIVRVALGGVVTEDLRELKGAVKIEGKARPVRVSEVKPAWRDKTPAIQIDSVVTDIGLRLTTLVEIRVQTSDIALTTRITNKDKAPIRAVQIGDSAFWPDGLTFAPGLGYVEAPTRGHLPWIARQGKTLSYAVAFLEGKAEVDFNFLREGPSDQVAVSARFDLAPGKTNSYKRLLIAKRADLARVAETAWTVTGQAVGRVKGSIRPVANWATIEAKAPEQGPLLVSSVSPDGSFDLPLPYGSYLISAFSPGGVDTQSVSLQPDAPEAAVEMFAPEPGKMSYKIANEKGDPIPVRLIVQGIPPTKNPVFGPAFVANGAGNVLCSSTGAGEIEIAQGRYRVVVTRGIEYELVQRNLSVDEGKGAVMRATLKKKVDTSGWLAADLHLHAAPSYDSEISLEDRVTSLLAESIGFAVATDHNVVTDYQESVNRLGASGLLITAAGVEVTTVEPTWGHFNVWPLSSASAPPPFAGITPSELFAYIREQAPDALIQVNHPWMNEYGIGYLDIAGLDARKGVGKHKGYSPAFDVIEVINGYEIKDRERVEANLRAWFNLLNLERHYAATGGSDSHRVIWQTAGYPRTYIRIPEETPPDAIVQQAAAAIRAGRSLVTTGPFIRLKVGGGEPGDLVPAVNGRVEISVSVSAPSWIDVDNLEVVVNGESIATSAIRAAKKKTERARISLRLPVSKDCWVAAVARGGTSLHEALPYVEALPLAFTNPVYVDADGDGLYTAPGNT
ncbi:MAG: PHP domain-containing protein [Deltaproteobacteria bacterium]|nr:PHP domain-containing protein [Deltaproteobacteria bacterium]